MNMPTQKPTTQTRPLRSDAERNRQAIICAAGSMLAEQGTGVTLECIAEAAGVGVGTIYRRFPSLEALVAVVLEEKMRRYADRTERAAEQALVEPWEAFRDYVMFILEQQSSDLAFSEVILSPRGASDVFHAERERAFRASVVLVKRVRAAGAVRPDFDHTDLHMLLFANGGLVRDAQPEAPLAWRRFGEYMLQAFRETGGKPLTPPSEIWTGVLAAEDH